MAAPTSAALVRPAALALTRRAKQLQFVSAQTTYNWDCCGMTMEYRSYTVANVRNENLFRFTFTLANIGQLRQPAPTGTAVLRAVASDR